MSSYLREKRSTTIRKTSSIKLLGVRLPSFLRHANTYGPKVEFDLTGRKDPKLSLEPLEELDKYDFTIPKEIEWTVGDVAHWSDTVVGLPQYKEAFYVNRIDGRKLVRLKASDFPKMNITNFDHIKHFLKCRRELFNVREEKYMDSIAFPNRDVVRNTYLELKSRDVNSGLTPQQFLRDENLIHECWDKQVEETDFPLLKHGRANVPIHELQCYVLNMDLIKQSEDLPFM